MTIVVSVAWALTVLVGFARHRPAPARLRSLTSASSTARPVDDRLVRWLPALAGATLTAFVMPLLAPVVLVGLWALPVVRARRRHSGARDEVRRSLPEVVDLFALCIGSGMTVPLAVVAVARRHHGPIAGELRRANEQMARGERCADALDDAAARLGPDAQALFRALAASDRYGSPLADELDRIAVDVRADRRRRAEAAARRVPVRLLFPLVLCVLPAFALLTVAPLLAGALGSLRH
jgi:tight adherence protein C